MDALTITLEPDQLAGLYSLLEIGRVADGSAAGAGAGAHSGSVDAGSVAASTAKSVFDDGLTSKLDALGLPWAPTPEEVKAAPIGPPR